MASKRRIKRRNARIKVARCERQCLGKLPYLSERDADQAAHAINKKKRTSLHGYPCPCCSVPGVTKWHLGHDVMRKGERDD